MSFVKPLIYIIFLIYIIPTYSRSLLSQEWDLLETGPWGSREGLMGVYYKGYVYMSGGRFSPNSPQNISQSIFYNDVWRMNSTCIKGTNCQWELLARNAPWDGRAYHIMFMHNVDGIEYFYIMAGQNLTYFFADVWRSTDAINWEQVKASDDSSFHGRAGLATIGNAFDGNMYMCCGCFNETPHRVLYNDVWSSKDGKEWTQVIDKSPFHARSGPRMQYYKENLYLIAGEHGFSENTQYGDVWKLDLNNINNNWELINGHAFLNRSGHGFSINNNNGAFYVVAGYYDLHDLLISNDYGITWKTLDSHVFNCGLGINKCGRYDFWSLIDYDLNNFWIYGGSSSYSTFGSLHNQTFRISLNNYN